MIIERKDALGKLLASRKARPPESHWRDGARRRIFKYFAGEGAAPSWPESGLGGARRRNPDLSRSRWRLWPDHALELPHRHSRWKIGPGAGLRKYRRPQAANPTPATAHALSFHSHEAGAPGPVREIWCWPRVVGDALSKHLTVNAISFTGSQTVGSKWRWRRSHQARVQLEMGGKNPFAGDGRRRVRTAPCRSRWMAVIFPPPALHRFSRVFVQEAFTTNSFRRGRTAPRR